MIVKALLLNESGPRVVNEQVMSVGSRGRCSPFIVTAVGFLQVSQVLYQFYIKWLKHLVDFIFSHFISKVRQDRSSSHIFSR